MHDGNSPSERNFFAVTKNLRGVAASFLMSLVLLWQFIWIGKILLHWCYKKRLREKSNKWANNNNKKISYVPVSAMSSFNLIEEFKLVRKKNMKKIKNGFNVCFQNKANVPITIISCGVCLKPDRNILSLWNTRQFPIIMLIFHWIHHETTHVWFYYNSCPMTVGIDCSACRDPEVD